MQNVMEALQKNFRQAFPKISESVFERNKIVLTRTYKKKWRKFFDFEAMYLKEWEAESKTVASDSDTPNERNV